MDTMTDTGYADPINTSSSTAQPAPQLALLDFFFPGFSVFTTAFQKYLGIDLNVYIPLVILCGGATFAWRYFSEYLWEKVEKHLMSTVEVRTDDEIYNILMSWVAAQKFAKNSRRFVVNTNLSSRSWFLWRWDDEEEESDESSDGSLVEISGQKKKPLAYTPSFGSHSFWYRGHLLLFKRSQNREQASYLVVSEREEISLSCFGRNPWVLKELLQEARAEYLKKDSQKTMIYRGSTRAGTTEPTWQRCMARTSRPFSTVILNEKTKKELVDDVADYLSPVTRKWYSNRGIPWRRGYLLTGPPGTGKSSLSLALAGFFKMRIYIVSLSSISANEENLATLFAELPRRCVVLLEDIDTAGLTHTRENNGTGDATADAKDGSGDMVPGQLTAGNGTNTSGRLSLSGLLNILDGVASQEGRVLIMTTNHVEKLDKALIRPGRVDQIVKFTLADGEIIGAIFRAIYAPLEGDEDIVAQPPLQQLGNETTAINPSDDDDEKKLAAQAAARTAEIVATIEALSETFVSRIPAHEFSPAEIQGYLMKHKRSAEAAVAGAAEWVTETRKEKKDKELKAAEEKRAAEAKEKEEAEKKRKEEAEEKEKEKKEAKEKRKEEREKKRKAEKKTKRSKNKEAADSSDSSSSSDSDSGSGSESEAPVKVSATATGETKSSEKKTVEEPVVVSGAKAEHGAEDVTQKRDSGYGTPVEV